MFIDSGDASRSGVASRGRAWSNGSGIAELAWESGIVFSHTKVECCGMGQLVRGFCQSDSVSGSHYL